MVVPDSAMPDGERTKLLDFGIAKLQARSTSLASTRQDQLMGTPGYMSPEQCRGAAGVDERSDVYSLGVVIYRLLAGRMPFIASGPGEIMAMHIYEEPPPLKLFGEWVPDAVATFTHHLLAKDKDARPHMTEVVSTIDRLLVEVPDTKPVVSVLPSALDESSQGAVSSLDHEQSGDGDSGDSDSVMPTVDAGSLESGQLRALAAAQQSQSPSTLAGSVVGQQRTLFRPVQLRSMALFIGGALAIVSIGGLFWQRRHPAASAQLQAPAVTAASPIAPIEKPVAPTAAPRIVRWSVYTDPPGATVVRVSDGRVLGETPWQSEHEAGPGSEELRLRLAGHVERLIRLENGNNATRHDVLEAVAAADNSVHGAPPEPLPKPKHEHKKPRNVAIEFED